MGRIGDGQNDPGKEISGCTIIKSGRRYSLTRLKSENMIGCCALRPGKKNTQWNLDEKVNKSPGE